MVTRTKNILIPATWCRSGSGGAPDACSPSNSAQEYRYQSWSRQKLPYVRTLAYLDRQYNPTCAESVYKYGSTTYYGYADLRASDWFAYIPGADEAGARTKCLLKVPQSTWSAPVFAAEAGETIEMMFSAAGTLVKAYKAVKKGRWKQACRALGISKPKGPAGNWLSYRYGWVPLLSDIKSAAEAAAYHWYEGEPPERVEARLRQEGVQRWTNVWLSTSDPPRTYFLRPTISRGNVVLSWHNEARAGLLLRSRSKLFQTMEQFGLANPASAAWDLLPLSFVADWFVGIGDYLASRTALAGWDVLDGWSSVQLNGNWQVFSTGRFENGQAIGKFPSGTCQARFYQRVPWDGKPSSYPQLSVNLNLSRVLDAASLIRQVFRH